MVWLKRFDFCDGSIGNTSRLALESADAVGIIQRPVEDRELGMRRNCNRQFCQAPDELIQGGAHTVQGIPDNEGGGIRHIVKLEAKDVSLICKIIITVKSICLSFSNELLKFDIESIKMHLRPTEFQIGIE